MHEPLITMPEICRALRVADARTAVAACERHNVPLTEISRNVRGLTVENYALLMARATTSSKPRTDPPPPVAPTGDLTPAEAGLIAHLRKVRVHPVQAEHIATLLHDAFAPNGERISGELCRAIQNVLTEQTT